MRNMVSCVVLFDVYIQIYDEACVYIRCLHQSMYIHMYRKMEMRVYRYIVIIILTKFSWVIIVVVSRFIERIRYLIFVVSFSVCHPMICSKKPKFHEDSRKLCAIQRQLNRRFGELVLN